MFGAITKRTLLALIPIIPIAILTTAGLALTGVTQLPVKFVSMPAEEESSLPPDSTSAPTEVVPSKTLVAQNQPSAQPDQTAQASEQAEVAEEPLPVLVVDKTALASALAEIDRAAAQAKLAVTALDADAQQRYIQETINLLAGSADPLFQRLAQAGNGDIYKGVRPQLIEARVIREAAEVQWIAAVQRQIEASARKHAELVAQAGSGTGIAPQPAPASAGAEIAAVVDPTGVLGTRGMRPEEQAAELVSRAIRQASGALGTIVNRPQGSIQDGTVDLNHASDQASQTMDAVLRMLDSARKIVQIAADR